MLERLLKLYSKVKIKFNYWKLTRKLTDNMLVQVPIPDFEDNVYLVTLPGGLAKVFAWVEVNLMYGLQWEEDHLRAFYQSVLDLIEDEQLDETLLLMHLHPESYVSSEEDEAEIDFKPE